MHYFEFMVILDYLSLNMHSLTNSFAENRPHAHMDGETQIQHSGRFLTILTQQHVHRPLSPIPSPPTPGPRAVPADPLAPAHSLPCSPKFTCTLPLNNLGAGGPSHLCVGVCVYEALHSLEKHFTLV